MFNNPERVARDRISYRLDVAREPIHLLEKSQSIVRVSSESQFRSVTPIGQEFGPRSLLVRIVPTQSESELWKARTRGIT